MWRGLGLAAMMAFAPGFARAHPHIYVDSRVDFLFDAEGRLTDLRVSWIYDALTSLFMLEGLGVDAAAPLTRKGRARLAAYQTERDNGYAGDGYLWHDGRGIGLSEPKARPKPS